MNLQTIDGKAYRLPGKLSRFQREMYVHLIQWKWKHICTEAGAYTYKGRLIDYDGILPVSKRGDFPHLYREIVGAFKAHRKSNEFRIHPHFYHMASSQAANINLFLPVLLSPHVDSVLQRVNHDFAQLARIRMPDGFRIEFSDERPGVLNDKTKTSGTDADIAIEYLNRNGDPCLWLIEHKLTEREFTKCGGAKSKGRVREKHDCANSFAALMGNKDACYYHSSKGFNYWKLTDTHQAFFSNPHADGICPFKGGLNQLWRNQLLALGIQHDPRQGYKQVSFSVVHHPDNKALDRTLNEYKTLIANNPNFSAFTSDRIVVAAEETGDPSLNAWAAWYRDLYKLRHTDAQKEA